MYILGCHAMVSWNGNWITFLDALLQQQLVVCDEKFQRLPKTLSSLMINPVLFAQTYPDGTGMFYSTCSFLPVCGGGERLLSDQADFSCTFTLIDNYSLIYMAYYESFF